MYHSGSDPLHRVGRRAVPVESVKKPEQRRLHKAFLRYHDANNWPMLRQALRRMGRADLIGNTRSHLVPRTQFGGPVAMGQPFKTQHLGLPKVPKHRRKSKPKPSGRG